MKELTSEQIKTNSLVLELKEILRDTPHTNLIDIVDNFGSELAPLCTHHDINEDDVQLSNVWFTCFILDRFENITMKKLQPYTYTEAGKVYYGFTDSNGNIYDSLHNTIHYLDNVVLFSLTLTN